MSLRSNGSWGGMGEDRCPGRRKRSPVKAKSGENLEIKTKFMSKLKNIQVIS